MQSRIVYIDRLALSQRSYNISEQWLQLLSWCSESIHKMEYVNYSQHSSLFLEWTTQHLRRLTDIKIYDPRAARLTSVANMLHNNAATLEAFSCLGATAERSGLLHRASAYPSLQVVRLICWSYANAAGLLRRCPNLRALCICPTYLGPDNSGNHLVVCTDYK